ncbi:uncharacterized protein LOC128992949 [Macrosteles quadrilineatus]|uniref:uncharacterized protein LOC128992949 n=1 Tax=Macrosteles quadrilineatus TaxID=74068 RepID=UPI0023E18A4E|nr:uncharacterized protein LOC128992949 [Macrosteles quadrilineatus]
MDLNCPFKILIEYVVDKEVSVSTSDWIALFPFGCSLSSSINLDLMTTFEFASCVPTSTSERCFRILFSLKGAKNLNYGNKYNFVYISRHTEVYGISKAFEFCPPMKIIPERNNISEESDDSSKENFDNNTRPKSNVKLNIPKRPTLKSVNEETENVSQNSNRSDSRPNQSGNRFIETFNKNKQIFVQKEMESESNKLNGIQHPPPPISCSNCHRVASLLKVQEELYLKVKYLAEVNKDLQDKISLLQQQLELKQAACRKLSLTLTRDWQARMFSQNNVAFDSSQQYQIMVLEPLVTYVVPSRYPYLDRPCEKGTKSGYSIRLKAIIGNQEKKILRLTKEIEELKLKDTERYVVVREVNEDEIHPELPAPQSTNTKIGKVEVKEEASESDGVTE